MANYQERPATQRGAVALPLMLFIVADSCDSTRLTELQELAHALVRRTRGFAVLVEPEWADQTDGGPANSAIHVGVQRPLSTDGLPDTGLLLSLRDRCNPVPSTKCWTEAFGAVLFL